MAKRKKRKAPAFLKDGSQLQSWSTLVVLQNIDRDKNVSPAHRKNADRLLIKAQRAFKSGEIDDAAKLLLRAYAENPGQKDIALQLADLFRRQGRMQEAIFLFEQMVNHSDAGTDPDTILSIAQLAQALGMAAAAERLFLILLQMDPDHANVYNFISNVRRELGNYDGAIELLEFAINQDPTNHQHWHSLAVVVAEDRGVDLAAPFYQEAIRLKPDFGAAHSNLGLAYCAEGRFEESLPHLETSMKLVGSDPNAHFSYATAYLGAGRLKVGLEHYEWRHDKGRSDSVAFTHDLPRWAGEDLSDKTLLICDEQGIGDAIIFSSCFAEIVERAAHTYIECDHRLVDLYQRSFPQATIHRHITYVVNGRVHRHYAWLKEMDQEKPDLAIEAGSILQFIRPTIESFERPPGYLKPDPERVSFWKARFDALGPGIKVGLCWSGGFITPVRKQHYITLTDMKSFFEIEGIQFINIMYTPQKDELKRAREELGVVIHDWDDIDRKQQIDDAFAYTAPLDFVVSVSSSPGAIAGVLGIPTAEIQKSRDKWMLNTFDRKPWFPNTRVFVPETLGDWPDQPILRIAEQLRQRVAMADAA